jgi:hypothetical protein
MEKSAAADHKITRVQGAAVVRIEILQTCSTVAVVPRRSP